MVCLAAFKAASFIVGYQIGLRYHPAQLVMFYHQVVLLQIQSGVAQQD